MYKVYGWRNGRQKLLATFDKVESACQYAESNTAGWDCVTVNYGRPGSGRVAYYQHGF
jgi:hypothetical protein